MADKLKTSLRLLENAIVTGKAFYDATLAFVLSVPKIWEEC